MRAILSVIFSLLVVLGQWGARFLAGSEAGREEAKNFLERLDIWLLKGAYSPTFLLIGLAGLFFIWIATPLARLWKEKWFGAKKREFLDQFNLVEQVVARRNFRWNLERAYRQYNPEAKNGELADMLCQLKWPDDFPPKGDKIAYAENIKWPDQNGQKIWDFMNTLFENVYDIGKRSEKFGDESEHHRDHYYKDLLMGRMIAAKFWGDWAQQMIDGLLIPSTIRGALESNKPDIRALAIAKLTLGAVVGWDRSKGNTALFLLARGDLDVLDESWFARARRVVASHLEKWARGIRNDAS